MENNNQNEELEIHSQPAFFFKPNEYHDWRQKGPFLVCKSCDIEHAVFVGIEKRLVGLDDKGRPILKKVSDLYQD